MLLIALLTRLQDDFSAFERKISIDVRGANGKQLTDLLSQKTGIRFEARDQATADRYIVHIEDAPLKDALERIADAENGEWVRLGVNEYRLRRSPTKLAAARAEAHAELVKKFAKALDGYRKRLAERPDFSDESAKSLAHEWRNLGPPPNGMVDTSGYWTRQNKLEQSVPVGRAFMRVLLAFSPEALADVPIERKTVYSTNPTPMQLPLPNGAFDALNDLVREQIVWEDAVAKYLPDQANQGWNGMATSGTIRNVTNAMIVLTRWDDNGGIQAQLMLSDKKTRIVTETYLYVDQQFENQSTATQPKPQPQKQEPDVPLPPVDTVLSKFFSYNAWDSRSRPPQSSEAARAIASDPEKYDPLSTFVADGIIGVARQRHENVAAVIDERTILPLASSIGKKGMNPRAIDNLRAWGSQASDEGKGWLVLRVKQPDRADEVRCDRHALRTMLDAARSKGRLTLDDAADYSLTSERFNENPIPQAYLAVVLDKQGATTLEQNDKYLLRFYGSLDQGQRNNAEHLSLGRLTAFQTDLLEKMVYGSNGNLQEEMTQPMQPDENGEYLNMWNTTAREPTVSLGNGIPPTGYVKITLANNHAILAHMHYGDWDQGYQTYEPSSLGWMIAGQNSAEEGYPWSVVGMQAADRTQVTFEFKYTPKISQTQVLQDVLPTTKETTFVEKLPDDLRKELQKAIDEAKKQYAGGGGPRFYGGWGGATSAPPF